MRIIETDQIGPKGLRTQTEKDWVYNGLDCCVTLEVHEAISPQLDNLTTAIYNFSRALQGPVLEMRLRGVLVDQARKSEVIDEYHDKIEILQSNLERIALEGVGMPSFNWRSNPDLHEIFYAKLGIPPIRKMGRPSVDRTALEKMEAYTIAKPIVLHLKALRDIGKKIGVLRTEIDPDSRIRTSYNIAGTNTGRFSSSFSEFGTGTNLQNIEESLRSIFIADPGMKFAKFDAKSGESFCVGAIEWNLFQDGRFLDACETGDPHTAVARICWPDLPWTGDLTKDQPLAEQPYYRHYTYRFMCKKIGHGSNYGGKPPTLAAQAKVPIGVVYEFQPRYFAAFPAHQQWQHHVEQTLRRFGFLVSLTGRKRWFFGRRTEDNVLREAIAYDPQCSLADIVNRGMLNVWRAATVRVVMQDHDAITVTYPEALEDEVIPKVQAQLVYPLQLKHGRTLTIPYDCKTGWNKGNYSNANPDGLKDYTPGDERQRQPKVSLLDRKFR